MKNSYPGTGMKPRVSLIVAMARNRVIGRQGNIPWRIPGEQKIFKRLTLGKALILGRKTYEKSLSFGEWSYPGKPCWVFSRGPLEPSRPDVKATAREPAEVVAEIAALGFADEEIALVRKRLDSTHWKRRLPTVAMLSATAIGEYYLRPVDY